ncbi:amidase [Streptosporangium saharense]|uniref:amidase n=1 Tax=Streptosporangium saharense TaxID=1706840 RepID=UPI00342119CB
MWQPAHPSGGPDDRCRSPDGTRGHSRSGDGAGDRAPPADIAEWVVDMDATGLRGLLASGRVTSVRLVRAYQARINAYEQAYADQPGVNAVIRMDPTAIADAARLDAERRRGHVRGPLHGIPILVKDNYDTGDLPTSSGSLALRHWRPADDAEQVARLRAAGAIVVAKTNLHEFASGVETISSLGGQTRNPYDQTRNPGGSSGGTGAGVAAGFGAAGLGSDTCGSIRSPAAHNSLVGLRPSQGLSSRDGISPLSDRHAGGGRTTGTAVQRTGTARVRIRLRAGHTPPPTTGRYPAPELTRPVTGGVKGRPGPMGEDPDRG